MTRAAHCESREAKLLIRCARTVFDPAQSGELASLARDIDWRRLLALAARHELSPLLHANLTQRIPEVIPQAILQKLVEECRATAHRNLLLTRDLVSLLGLFREAGILVIALKGPVLAEELYDDVLLRPFSDIDILVPRHEAGRAKDLLIRDGYKPTLQLSRPAEQAFVRSQCEREFRRDDRATVIELHWAILPRSLSPAFDSKALWRRARGTTFAGTDVLTPAPEDLLLFLCAHGAKHQWSRLKWLVDISALVAMHSDLDWHLVLDTAAAARECRPLWLGMLLAHDVLDAPVPPDVLKCARRDSGVDHLAALVKRAISLERWALDPIELERFQLAVRESRRDKLRYMMRLGLVPTVADYSVATLPTALSIGYYAVRPFRLTKKYVLRYASNVSRTLKSTRPNSLDSRQAGGVVGAPRQA